MVGENLVSHTNLSVVLITKLFICLKTVFRVIKELNVTLSRTIKSPIHDHYELIGDYKSLAHSQIFAWCISDPNPQLLKPSVNCYHASWLKRRCWMAFGKCVRCWITFFLNRWRVSQSHTAVWLIIWKPSNPSIQKTSPKASLMCTTFAQATNVLHFKINYTVFPHHKWLGVMSVLSENRCYGKMGKELSQTLIEKNDPPLLYNILLMWPHLRVLVFAFTRGGLSRHQQSSWPRHGWSHLGIDCPMRTC